ncbi:MAG: hypothetical protein IJN37_06190 [Clostridia bacterium]|nr:hypothetical protein [Clostridia bacterium]
MKKIFIIQGGGRSRGNTAQLVESFKKGAEYAGNSVEVISFLKHQVNGCLGFNNKGMYLAGGCGGTNGAPLINETYHLEKVYQSGKNIYK